MSKKPSQAWHCEPVKSDFQADKFRIFCNDMFDIQRNELLQKYSKHFTVPVGYVWDPMHVDQKKSNSLYMQLELLLLGVMCIHYYYCDLLNINIYDILRNLLGWNTHCGGHGVVLQEKIQVRRIKKFKISNGAANATIVGKDDFGFFKQPFVDEESKTTVYDTVYGRLKGGLAFKGLEQLIPSFKTDFPGGIVMVVQEYGILNEWSAVFETLKGAKTGSVACVKQGKNLILKGLDKVSIYSPNTWIEQLFLRKHHTKLCIEQWQVLQNKKIPEKYVNYKTIRCLYMTLDSKMRSAKARHKKGGCGLVHVCESCNKLGCYEHLSLNDPDFDFCSLKYELICNCGFGLGPDDKIGVRSTFQGAIPSYLCDGNSNPILGTTALKWLRNMYED